MKKQTFLKILIVLLAVAAIVLTLPRSDRSAYIYEEGQPWRYALLTAPFDIPIYLDSTTNRHQTDSITRNFAPYVNMSHPDMADLRKMLITHNVQMFKVNKLAMLLSRVYEVGVVPETLKKRLMQSASHSLRSVSSPDSNTAVSIDGSNMRSPSEAAKWVVDNYDPNATFLSPLDSLDVAVLNQIITPNVDIDKENNDKFMALELQSVNAGQGKIRQGQRIVDRGEIITPQIYRNLQTYEEMLSKSNEKDHTRDITVFLAQLLYVLIVFGMLYLYLGVYRPKVFSSVSQLCFIVSLITIFTVMAALMFENFSLGLYLTPFCIVPVMVLIFIDSRTAFMTLLVMCMLCVLVATYQFQFIISEVITGFMALVSLNQLTRRSQLLRTSFIVFVSYSVTGVLLIVMSGGELHDLDWRMFMAYGVNAVLFSITYVLIFLAEKIFGFTSTVTLVELSDINNPLLRRLAEEAPGTFQHSIQVSTLASDAARAIGANTQLVRTGALYHDIGKMITPVFFTENQHGVNPHNGLDPETSARKIISHVTEGEALARKSKLPKMIVDFIREHHGRGLTKYFYNMACNNSPTGEADPAPFRYPGPDPQSKETALLMMADAVEAASRSLKEYTPESISELVDRIIDGQVAEGRFRESPVSFADIDKIKDTFKRRLSTIYHTRVAYPERKHHA